MDLYFAGRPVPLKVSAEGEMQVHAFAQAGGSDFCEFDFRAEVFAGEAQDGG
jgi:hypothetical protein